MGFSAPPPIQRKTLKKMTLGGFSKKTSFSWNFVLKTAKKCLNALFIISIFLTLSTTESTTTTQEPSPCGCSNGEPVPYKCLPPTNQNCESCDSGYILNESVVVRPYLNARGYSYSAFKSGPTASIWSFLEIFRIIFGKKTEIFEIALPAPPSGSF